MKKIIMFQLIFNFKFVSLFFLIVGIAGCSANSSKDGVDLSSSAIAPNILELYLPESNDRAGGLIAADVNNDGRKDFIITKPGHLVVYGNSGKKLWTKQIDIQLTGKAAVATSIGMGGSTYYAYFKFIKFLAFRLIIGVT